ncbi:stage II sporulation protein M [Thermococcus argininiproducens]|uniref:Stage II sporulation protein M n=1 Tax=Thermococcus argininiproducens TaxID=2866384 RepID=A0A9E7MBX1_9EURY|nr:stage II sporulation protein M [Thermococcus argininiproducens]USH00413.1 stage II sporulation protein M [Thermococcus argininiproducens]
MQIFYRLLVFSMFLFLIGAFLGFNLLNTPKSENVPNIFGFYEKQNEIVPNFRFLFINNLKVILILSFGGILTFGGLTIWGLIFNGIPLGLFLHSSWNLRHVGELNSFFFLILPHGIFEIPALIIAGAAGFKIPYELLRFALGKKKEMITEEDAKEFFKLLAISVILIFIAAMVESRVTLKLATYLVEYKLF